MKKLIFAVTVVSGLMAGGALASSLTYTHPRPSDAEVNKAIDLRLHAMLVKLNAEKK